MKRLFPIVCLLLAACASGVVPTGEDTYLVTRKSPGCGFASAEGTKADLYKDANEFCKKSGKVVQTIDVVARDGVPFVRCASAELNFQCVSRTKSE